MTETKNQAFHGSDLEEIEKFYHIPKEEILCFGANVNPLGLSSSAKKILAENLDLISRYPDRNYTSLKETISSYCGISPSCIVPGNGSTELISLLISRLNARHAVVIGPTYGEYERELLLNQGQVTFYNLKWEDEFRLDLNDFLHFLPPTTDLVILCNPNNPTSSAVSREELDALLTACSLREIFVMIDETYMEFAPSQDTLTAVPLTAHHENLMVIRGLSKFFAAPGLRLGYGITGNAKLLSAFHIYQNPWSVSSIAAFAGEQLLKDAAYIRKSRKLIDEERRKICRRLDLFPYAGYVQPQANFILVQLRREGLTSFQVFEHAIRQKMMIRDCSSFHGLHGQFIRFCILMPEENNRLLDCLAELLA